MLAASIDSTRSQPALSAGMSGMSAMSGHGSSPLLATSDDLSKCKYVAKSAQLGDGNFSVVKECINVQTRECYAMKLVHKNLVRDKLELIYREFRLLRTLSAQIRRIESDTGAHPLVDYFQGHHHVLQLYDYFETHDSIVLITQLCDKDDLYEHITTQGHLDLQRQVAPYTACLLSVLRFLHAQGIVHRDIKAENVLFRRNKRQPRLGAGRLPDEYDLAAHDLILGDFGLATRTSDSGALTEYVGTISYIAPEIVRCKNSVSETPREKEPYGAGVDIWALGVLVYFMAFGYTPFDCETDDETLDCIAQCDYYVDDEAMQDPDNASLWDFLRRCYVVDKAKRPSAALLTQHLFVSRYFDTEEAGSALRPGAVHRNRSFNTLRETASSDSDSDDSRKSISTPMTHYSYGAEEPSHNASFMDLDAQENVLTKTTSHGNNAPGEQRPGLRRTISMTAVKSSPSAYRVNKSNNASIIASHSTFFLDPAPPRAALMHGTYSEAPLQLSNFNTTPKATSRNNSSRSLFSLINGASGDKSTDPVRSEHWRTANEAADAQAAPVTFDLGDSDDEDA